MPGEVGITSLSSGVGVGSGSGVGSGLEVEVGSGSGVGSEVGSGKSPGSQAVSLVTRLSPVRAVNHASTRACDDQEYRRGRVVGRSSMIVNPETSLSMIT
jgi:hypothetical protein